MMKQAEKLLEARAVFMTCSVMVVDEGCLDHTLFSWKFNDLVDVMISLFKGSALHAVSFPAMHCLGLTLCHFEVLTSSKTVKYIFSAAEVKEKWSSLILLEDVG